MTYYLKFDDSVFYGSAEHFWHYMWGYMLPVLLEISKIESELTVRKFQPLYLLRSCGPMMDHLTIEIMGLYKYPFEIINNIEPNKPRNCTTIVIPRWDRYLFDSKSVKNIVYPKRTLERIINRLVLPEIFYKNRLKAQFIKAVLDVKENVTDRVDQSLQHLIDINADEYLILKRSSPVRFYLDGKAEVAGYGTSRRALTNIEEAVEELNNIGVKTKIFEPGRHSLQQQIQAFRCCKGIIGIKGAEFANMIWLPQQAKVIQITPNEFNTPPVQRKLAQLLQLEFKEILVNDGLYPKLCSNAILEFVG